MIKRISAPLIMVLVLVSLSALAESAPYIFGNLTLPIPDNLYVLTRDKHDVVALGLENNISQYFADTLFESQPSLQIDCMRIDPFFEISVSQQPVQGITDFSKSTPEQLEECWNVLKEDLQSKQVDLRDKMEIYSHSQTNFFYYRGITAINGSTAYISAYVTCENNMMTTIALQTYDSPAEDDIEAVLDNIIQGTALLTIP